jgi:hypothetical protein
LNLNETLHKDINFGRKVSLFTFLVATLLMIIFYLTEFKGTIYFVFLYFFTALGFNSYIFLKLAISFFKEVEKRTTILFTLCLLLINIPLGILYTDLGFKLYNSIMSNY